MSESRLGVDQSLGARLLSLADTDGERVAVVDEHGAVTYFELVDRARRVVAWLRDAGVSRDSVLAAQMHNTVEYAVLLAACAFGGFVLAPISPRLGTAEVAPVLRRLGAAAFVSSVHAAPAVDFTGIGLAVRRSPKEGERSFSDMAVPSGPPTLPAPASRAAILLTSGTESEPKLVAHSHASFDAGAVSIVERAELDASDVVLVTVPVTSSTGTHGLLWAGLFTGSRVVLLDGWEPNKGVRVVAEQGCTFCLAPTTILFDLVEAAAGDATRLRSLRLFVCGGAPIDGALVQLAADRLGCAVVPMYGASECLAATMGSPHDALERVTRSDGSPLRDMSVEARGDAGERVAAGEMGELWVKGPTVFEEYVGWPERTSATLVNGWFRTGDLGVVDAEGYVRVVDRKKDVIIRGGVNISSREVEQAVAAHSDVADVAVVGMPDERLGERICAFLVLRDPASPVTVHDLAAHLDSLGIAKQRRPERVVVVGALPRTSTGKIIKRSLRDRAQELGPIEGA